MKTLSSILVSFVLAATLLFAAKVDFSSFAARSNGSDITVEWRLSTEQGVERYDIERSLAKDISYTKVGTVEFNSANAGSYRFVDANAYMRGDNNGGTGEVAGTVYVYRIKAVTSDNGAVYTSTISVTHTVSSVRRTWGMIKEMFR